MEVRGTKRKLHFVGQCIREVGGSHQASWQLDTLQFYQWASREFTASIFRVERKNS